MKVSKVQIIRRVSQMVSFIFFAGVFILAFSGLEQIYNGIISKSIEFSKLQMFIIPVAIVVALTVLFGRVFCGWFCAFGALNDFIYMIAGKIFKRKLINNNIINKIDSKLKYLKYILLALIIIFVWTLKIVPDSDVANYSPWTAFAQVSSFASNWEAILVGYILLGIIIIGAVFIERFFCRYLCPLGAFMGIISKIKIVKINKPSSNCGKCRLCSASCPMGINLSQVNTIKSGECIGCLKCVSACPRENAKVNILTRSFNGMVYAVSAIIIFFIANIFGEAFITDNNSSISQSGANTASIGAAKAASSTQKSQYKDGTYEGTGVGFRPNLNVSVTVKNGAINGIQIISTEDTPGFKEQPIEIVPNEIIKSQSTDVDVVSGATYTSRGIISAVQNALEKARA